MDRRSGLITPPGAPRAGSERRLRRRWWSSVGCGRILPSSVATEPVHAECAGQGLEELRPYRWSDTDAH